MTFVRFIESSNKEIRYGLLKGDIVQVISGSPFFTWVEKDEQFNVHSVKLLAPSEPSKSLALARNFRDHLHGTPEPAQPEPFWKSANAIIGPGDEILLPQGVERVDAEGEAVAVIGSKCSEVSETEAVNYIFGYTCGNDVSARAWQGNDNQWWRAKSADTFGPIGPNIVTDIDPADLTVITRVNGKEVQNCNLKDMIFNFAKTISFISQSVTLQPGDLVFSGTSGTPAQIKDGDICEVELSGIGCLQNPVRLK